MFWPFKHLLDSIARKQLKKEGRKYVSLKMTQKRVQDITIDMYFILEWYILISLGALSAAFWLEAFLIPNKFIDGGVTGISLILNELLPNISLSALLIIINIPFIILGFFTISRLFAIRSIFGITLLALCVAFVHFPVLTNDTLLVAVFGWVFLGVGIGLAIRGGWVIDGTEVLAIYIDKHSSFSIGDIILLFNIIIFAFASWVFSLEVGMYGMLTYLVASKTVNMITSGVNEYAGIQVISEYNNEVRDMLLEKYNMGCTIFQGKSGYEKKGVWKKYNDILYMVISRLELASFETDLEKIDPDALVIISNIKDIQGDFVRKHSKQKKKRKK